MNIKRVLQLLLLFVLLITFSQYKTNLSYAQDTTDTIQVIIQSPTPIPCGGEDLTTSGTGCPITPQGFDYQCASSYEDWKKNPTKNFWVVDEEITFLGKNAERARQFVYWVINRKPIYFHKSITESWEGARTVALSLVIFLAVLTGILIIAHNKFKFEKINIHSYILKLIGVLIFVFFSLFITITLINLTDILMNTFIENLNVTNLFNIFFKKAEGENLLSYSEVSYKNFIGCKNLNIAAVESLKTSIFLIKATNLTYFLIGIIFLIRQLILWFLIIVSPFLAILLYLRISKNVGLIWIGVFLQWAFYGPLTALFLGTVTKMWEYGIPFNFSFNRAGKESGFIYPTAISILYGGPSQKLSIANSSNYVDTFVEYIISILMLWIAIILPWWLLRTFRDYCCEGIYAIKNMLLNFYENYKGKPPKSPYPPKLPGLEKFIQRKISTTEKLSTKQKTKVTQIQNIRNITTEEMISSFKLKAKTLQDIARIETNVENRKNVQKIITALKQPDRIASPQEREKIMTLKTELHSRAKRNDKIAQKVIQLTSASILERKRLQKEIAKNIPAASSATKIIEKQTQVSQQKITSILNTFVNRILQKETLIKKISTKTKTSPQQIKTFLTNLTTNLNKPLPQAVKETKQQTGVKTTVAKDILKNISHTINFSKIISQISEKHKIKREKIVETIRSTKELLSKPATIISFENLPHKHITTLNKTLFTNNNITKFIASETKLQEDKVKEVLEKSSSLEGLKEVAKDPEKRNTLTKIYDEILDHASITEEVAKTTDLPVNKVENTLENTFVQLEEPEENIEKTIEIPPTVPIEEYENTKKLWEQHYLKGEVPVSENITSREEWLEQDIVFLTNILNKLLSGDEKLKEEAIEDLSYILPIFVINDMPPEKLLIYLKARLEAAKSIRERIEKEKELREEIKKELKEEQEEFIEIPLKRKKAKAKTLEQKLEEELPKEENEV